MRTLARASVLAFVLCATPAAAQSEGRENDRAQAFQAVEGAVQEDVPGGPLLIGAYALIWLVVFGYLVRLVRLQAGAEGAIARLEKALGDGAAREK